MTDPLSNARRLLIFVTVAMAIVALIGWGAYAYSEHSSAARDRERLDALARIATQRDGLASEQERLQRELGLANAQLAAAQDKIAALEARKGDLTALVEAVDAPRKTSQKRR